MTTPHTQKRQVRRRLVPVLLLPLLLVLAGCFRLDMGITINDNETADVSMEVADLTGMLGREDMDCSSFESEIASGEDSEDIDFAIEETEDDGKYGCLITATGAPLESFNDDSMNIERDGDNYVFTFTGDDSPADEDMPEGMEPEVSISVTFPGSVVEADDNAEIDGNIATWNGLAAFSAGGTATGEASGSVLGGGGSSSTIIWIVLAVVVLLAIAALIFFLVKKKQGTAAPAAAGYGTPGAAGYPQVGQQPGYPQPGQQPGYAPPPPGSAPPAPQDGPPQPPSSPGGPEGH